MRGRRGLIGLLVGMLVLFVWNGRTALPAGQGSQKEQFRDPLSGLTVWRMTSDGRDAGVINHQGDMSGEASAFSPDSRYIVFAKARGRGTFPRGVYIMEIASGVERLLARTNLWNPYPVFSRDGTEVYFYDRTGQGVHVKAVSVETGVTRRLAYFDNAEWQEKIEVNADGSLVSVHIRVKGVYYTYVMRRNGAFVPGWDPSPLSGDGAMWNPVYPERLLVRRGSIVRAWNVFDLSDTSWKWSCESCDVAHAAWHPNGELYFAGGYVVNARTGEALGGTGIPPIHPYIHPLDAARGLDARLTADEAPWFFKGKGRPRLYTPTLRQAMRGDFRHQLVAVHYSSYAKNSAHPHPHWSPDGRFIFFVSDTGSDLDGLPPGQPEKGREGTDIFLVEVPEDKVDSTGHKVVAEGFGVLEITR